jgi:hypothetical protein
MSRGGWGAGAPECEAVSCPPTLVRSPAPWKRHTAWWDLSPELGGLQLPDHPSSPGCALRPGDSSVMPPRRQEGRPEDPAPPEPSWPHPSGVPGVPVSAHRSYPTGSTVKFKTNLQTRLIVSIPHLNVPKIQKPRPLPGIHQLWRVAEAEPVPGEAGVQALVLVLWRHQWAPSERDCLWSSDRATRLAEHSPTGCSSRRRGTPSHLPRLSTFGSHPAGNGAGTATSFASEAIRITGAETMPR